MTVETRYYDNDGDGHFFKLQPVDKLEDDVVDLITVESYADTETVVRLSAKDVERLVEELSKYLPAKAIPELDKGIYRQGPWVTNNTYDADQ